MQGYGFCRGCGKQILWTTMLSGKAMPCDPEVIMFEPGGDELFVTPKGMTVKGTRCSGGQNIGYISHFATCQKSNRFKRGQTA